MIRKSTIAALSILATVGAVSPAFALVANSPAVAGGGSIGYNRTNVLTGTAASTYGLNSPETNAIAGGSSGLHAFAILPRAHVRAGVHAFDMVPRVRFGSNRSVDTGGGSIGYNSNLLRDY
jgi:hypothetical protein